MLHNEQTESPNIPLYLKPARSHGLAFNAKAHNGIARRAGRSPSEARKLPKQRPRSPRRMMEYGRPLWANPWEWRHTTSPAGSSGGSADGASPKGLCLAAPPRPPSAARRAGGPNSRKEKLSCPQGTETSSQRTGSTLFSQGQLQRDTPRRPRTQAS